MDIAGWGAMGAARDPRAQGICSEEATDKAFPALPRELLGTTLCGHRDVCGRDSESHQDLALSAKRFREFYTR